MEIKLIAVAGFWETLIKKVSESGDFALGVVVGGLMNYFVVRLALGEIRKTTELVVKREARLDELLNIKDQRIEELHNVIGGRRSGRRSKK